MPRIYYREGLLPVEELAPLLRHFPASSPRLPKMEGDLVIGRYSMLPHYRDIEADLAELGASLIHSYRAHRYIAGFEWYQDLRDLTPETWFRLSDVPRDGGPFVLKGATNSRKFEWDTHMYAADWDAALEVESRLRMDSMIGEQDIIIRRYEPLRLLERGLHGLPFSNEWRFFFLGTECLSYGFYWSIAEARGSMDAAGLALAEEAARRIAPHARFFALDIAEMERGGWCVIEVNDGQMAGLSENDPETMYAALARALNFNRV